MTGQGLQEHTCLNIEQFRTQYLVSTEHPEPGRVRSRLDDAVTKSLPATLAGVVSRWFSQADESIWLIRRLELELDLNATWDRDQIARCWAAKMVRRLAETLQSGADGHNVLHFDSRVEYLARFLADLADGRAWDKWYYQSFEGLRMLPVSTALRTAICDEPTIGLGALLELNAVQLAGVLRALTVQDARRILDSVAINQPAAEDVSPFFEAVWAAWGAVARGPLQADEEAHNVLRLYLCVCAADADAAGQTLRSAAQALLRLALCLTSGSTEAANRLIEALGTGDLPTLYRAASSDDAEMMIPLLRCPSGWVKEVAQALLADVTGRFTSEPAAAAAVRDTPFGGIFLLLPLLDELPLEQATQGWPDTEEATAVDLARFLILIKCCGQQQAQGAFYDYLLRNLLAVDSALSPAVVDRWGASLSRKHLAAFLDNLAVWRGEKGAVGWETLLLVRVCCPSSPVAVLIDSRRGVWLTAKGYKANRLERLADHLRPWLSPLELLDSTLLITENEFTDELQAAYPRLLVEEISSQAVAYTVDEDSALAGILARLDKLPDETSYLAFPRLFRLPRPVDLALSVAAQGLMRAFAWRLPGFAGSSLPYLHRNFLDFGGSLEEEAERRVVRLGRPPLNLILNITGLCRQTYHLSWLDQRPFVLFQEG